MCNNMIRKIRDFLVREQPWLLIPTIPLLLVAVIGWPIAVSVYTLRYLPVVGLPDKTFFVLVPAVAIGPMMFCLKLFKALLLAEKGRKPAA